MDMGGEKSCGLSQQQPKDIRHQKLGSMSIQDPSTMQSTATIAAASTMSQTRPDFERFSQESRPNRSDSDDGLSDPATSPRFPTQQDSSSSLSSVLPARAFLGVFPSPMSDLSTYIQTNLRIDSSIKSGSVNVTGNGAPGSDTTMGGMPRIDSFPFPMEPLKESEEEFNGVSFVIHLEPYIFRLNLFMRTNCRFSSVSISTTKALKQTSVQKLAHPTPVTRAQAWNSPQTGSQKVAGNRIYQTLQKTPVFSLFQKTVKLSLLNPQLSSGFVSVNLFYDLSP